MQDLLRRLRRFRKYNHIIGTLYKEGADYIGFHSDKIRSWVPESSVAILSFGATREFQLMDADGKVTSFSFRSGDLFVLGWKDNQKYKHSIPAVDACEPRISLCFRHIQECYTLAQLDKKIKSSEKARCRRDLKKAERLAEKKI